MEASREELQVVQVINSCRLLDAESCERTYWRRDGLGLAPGWYVASWPPGVVAGRFKEETAFRGPFSRREDAQAAMAQMSSRARLREAPAAKPADSARPAHARGHIEFGANDP